MPKTKVGLNFVSKTQRQQKETQIIAERKANYTSEKQNMINKFFL